MNERWKDITKYEDYYKVSNLGRVKSIDRITIDSIGRKKLFKGVILKQDISPAGYKRITLNKDGGQITKFVHRLVAQEFIPNPNKLPYINHIDCNKINNTVENLEWVTPLENNLHAIKNNLRKNFKKVNQYDLSGNLLNTFDSQRDASLKTGVCYKQINACIKNKQKSAHNFIWKLKDV